MLQKVLDALDRNKPWKVYRHGSALYNLLKALGIWPKYASLGGLVVGLPVAYFSALAVWAKILLGLIVAMIVAVISLVIVIHSRLRSVEHVVLPDQTPASDGLEFAGWTGASQALLPVHWPVESESSVWISVGNAAAVDAKNVTSRIEFVNHKNLRMPIVPEAIWWELNGITQKGNIRVPHAQHSIDIAAGDDQSFLFFSQDSDGRAIPYKDANEPLDPLETGKWRISVLVTSDNIKGFEAVMWLVATRGRVYPDPQKGIPTLRSVPPRLESIQRSLQ